jgi:hypothetical protein
VDEKKLVGSASIEPDGEITMQVDPGLLGPALEKSEGWGMSIQPEQTVEEMWAKRRTY